MQPNDQINLTDDESRIMPTGGKSFQQRVLTRLVQKYTLTARPESSGAHEAVGGGTGHARDLGVGVEDGEAQALG